MPKRIYKGSYAEVEVYLPDGTSVLAARGGDPIEVPADLASQLDEQGNTWVSPASDAQMAKTMTADGEKE